MISINQACSVNPKRNEFVLQDTQRIQHAQQLLPSTYSQSDIKSFEGDFKLASYIEMYITQENLNLDATKLTETLLKVSRQQGYDPVFLLAVIKTESQFNPNIVGSAGEIGLMQIKPSTAAWICHKKKIKWKGAEELKDPSYNVLIGAHYFHYLKKSLNSKSMRYINAYNMGINNLQRLPAAEQKKHPYYGRVISNYKTIYSELLKYRQTI